MSDETRPVDQTEEERAAEAERLRQEGVTAESAGDPDVVAAKERLAEERGDEIDDRAQDAREAHEERAEAANVNPNFRPDPTAMSGTLDTSGTSGGASERLENISPVFDAADAPVLKAASQAHPEDEALAERAAAAAERAAEAGLPVETAAAVSPEGTAMAEPRDPGAVVETDEDGNVVLDEETGEPVTHEGDVEGVNEDLDQQ